MELFTLLLLIVLVVLVISLRNNIHDRFSALENEIHDLGDLVKKQLASKPEAIKPAEKTEDIAPAPPKASPVAIPESKPVPPKPAPAEDYWQSGFKRMDEPPATSVSPASAEAEKSFSFTPPAETNKIPWQPLPKPSFSERYPDLEKFIGENLVSKIGIVILVIAIGFFVKYAIDQNWIGPAGRVGIGIFCGAILVGLAHRLRNVYRAFSSVLTGGGLAVMYFTITLAFQQFHLFGQTTAFIIMVIITAFSVALAFLYNKQEVAILALIGGFATPFMASNGGNNYLALFTYLLILDAGLLVISYYKKWRLLNLLAFVFTIILFTTWLATLKTGIDSKTYLHGLWFATAFYIVFFAVNVAHNIRQNKQFIASDFGIILANTALYFSSAIYCLAKADHDEYRGLLCIALAVFNLGISYTFFRNKKVDTNILYLLIGITLSFISLAAPLQLKGNQITLFWSCETVLLYWLYQKSKIKIMQVSSMLVWACMLVSLFLDWSNIYFIDDTITVTAKMMVLLNKGFIASLFGAVATAVLHTLRKKDAIAEPTDYDAVIPSSLVFGVAAVLLLYIGGALEINYHFDSAALINLYLPLYTYLYILLLLVYIHRQYPQEKNNWTTFSLLSLCVIIFLINVPFVFNIQRQWREGHAPFGPHFMTHWFSALVVGFIIYRIIQSCRQMRSHFTEYFPAFIWTVCVVVISFLSVELHLLVNTLAINDQHLWKPVHIQFIKIGLPILWSLSSFVFMWLGMQHKQRTLRIISLVLFGITLLKLFVYDIRNIAEGGKIAAFFCLGVILLIVSFMYQRLKKIIIAEEKPVANE